MTSRPVSTWENSEVNGMALCLQRVLDIETAKVQRLRVRQAEYLASLPSSPEQCLISARQLLHVDGESLPEGLEDALNLSFALGPMIADITRDSKGPMRDALIGLATRLRDSLLVAVERIEHVADILENPARIQRDARIFAAFPSDQECSNDTFR